MFSTLYVKNSTLDPFLSAVTNNIEIRRLGAIGHGVEP
jgi:hypothetical protein